VSADDVEVIVLAPDDVSVPPDVQRVRPPQLEETPRQDATQPPRLPGRRRVPDPNVLMFRTPASFDAREAAGEGPEMHVEFERAKEIRLSDVAKMVNVARRSGRSRLVIHVRRNG
jgi:hypothetical protein